MPIVFVIARDWILRRALRAELREIGIEALGMETAEDAGRALASGTMPAAVVLEASDEILGNDAMRTLLRRVPSILIASRTETVSLPAPSSDADGRGNEIVAVLYRPVRIGEIVERVRDLLAKGHAA
jgi:hypothetical protein